MNADVRSASSSNKDQEHQLQLNKYARKAAETLPAMISAIKTFSNAPQDVLAHTKLVHAARPCIQPGFALIESAIICSPFIADTEVQASLTKASAVTGDSLLTLDKILKLVDDLNSDYQMENAMISIKSIKRDLIVEESAGFDSVYATSELAQADLFGVAASIHATIAMLAETATKGNEKETGAAATNAVLALQSLSVAVHGYAAFEEDENYRDQLLNATSGVGDTLAALLAASKLMTAGNYKEDISVMALKTSKAVNGIVGYMPGQRELELAMINVSDIVEKAGLYTNEFKSASDKNVDAEQSLTSLENTATKMVTTANSILASSRGTTEELNRGTKHIVQAFKEFVDATLLHGSNVDEATTEALSSIIQDVGTFTATLLQGSKGLAADKQNINFRDQLLESAKEISDSMSGLLGIFSLTFMHRNLLCIGYWTHRVQ
jgi:hypothetical protein